MTSPNRRTAHAEATRQAILAAARRLFVERGYFETRVEDIARAAHVGAPAVYATGGGKSGLLRTLIEAGTHGGDADAIHARIAAETDPDALLRFIVDATRGVFEEWAPLIRQVTDAAPQDPAVRESLETAHAGLRRGLFRTADRLAELGALQPGLDAGEAADLLWYFLNDQSYFTLTGDLCWPPSRAADWLHHRLRTVLLH
ncbi:TetR/AcrR family transcriptional regulator [Catenuloplanes atrovinosus]|uniref:AcrR family transcriptional regulator n=1 Tax=Catenuloplanes atrovinosus TaxID=137266 RepID=A0AAE4C8P1_9ACTN|nr:helix-turn-helix domain-containing protein [Catenuloplanes atrovinosus]MDR7275188.1 AcrR family transcriptional regulator [Catenuloplanes atrovinosus]